MCSSSITLFVHGQETEIEIGHFLSVSRNRACFTGPCGLVVTIPTFGLGGQGSIPGTCKKFFFYFFSFFFVVYINLFLI